MTVRWLDIDIPLLPVAVPTGWILRYHQLYDVHPDCPIEVGNCPGGDYSELFKATLLVLEHVESPLVIDVGWGPEADLSGAFCVQLIKGYDYRNPLTEVRVRDPRRALREVERLIRRSRKLW